jgi:hypothetical protein
VESITFQNRKIVAFLDKVHIMDADQGDGAI